MTKNFTLKSLFSLLLFLVSGSMLAQLQVNSSVTANALANQIVGSGVTISNVQLDCAPEGYGIFTNGNTTNIGMVNGVLLTTGDAEDAIGPNVAGNTSVNLGSAYHGNASLDAISNWSLNDACALSFDFVANSNIITVQYVFASEEYNEYVCSQFNDIFGFFVNGPKPSGGNYNNQNLALVPSTTTPVSVNSINNGSSGVHGDDDDCIDLSNGAYYIDNTTGATIGYDGFTITLTATVEVIPGQSYSFEFAIADVSDGILDSGVFIKGSSFSTFLCQSGSISFETAGVSGQYCTNDDIADIFHLTNNAVSESDFYTYILTDNSGNILDIDEDGDFNLNSYGAGTFKFYGLSYSGIVSGIAVGNNISDISVNAEEGCFELSTPLTVIGEECTDLPVLECPDSIEINCSESVPPVNTGAVEIISTACGCNNNVYWIGDQTAGNSCSYTITRTYAVTDNCNNTGTCTQMIHVVDETNPYVLSAPATNIEVSCDGPMPALEVTFDDNCDQDLTITDGSSTENLDCGATITRWVTATDDCGNFVTFTQTVNVVDDTAPYIVSAPEEEIWVECDADVPALAVEFADNCDADLDIQQISGIAPMDCGYDISRSITATDNCGNSISFGQVVHIRDTTNPTIVSAPAANIEVSCDGPMPALEVTFDDNCDQDLTITDGSSTENLDCGATITRWVTATDDCGNFVTFTQTVNVVDDTAPYIVSAPEEEIWVECDADVPALAVEFADNCDADLDIQQISGIAPMDCGYDISRSITATDNCGNYISFGQVVHIRDTTNPTIVSAPAEEIWVECDAEVPTLVVEFADNCDMELELSEISGIIITECGYDIARSITATDDCGNSITFSQGVHIRDTTAPIIVSQPEDVTILCTDAEPEMIAPVFADNCDEVLDITPASSIVQLECGYEIQRTWTATDDCGNQTTATQTITVTDNVPPVINPFVPYLGMSCTEVDEYVGITATDNCNEVTITWVDQLNSGGCLGTLMRTYYATDACGNQSTAVQYISIHDLVGPVIMNPADATVECDEAPTSIPEIVIYDECGFEVEILEASQTITEGDGCTYQIVWHWVAMDYCENISEATTVITVTDTTAPTVAYIPQDQYFSCDADYTAPTAPIAYDNCAEVVTITPIVEMIPGDCPQSYAILYIWEYTDNCGNATTVSVTHHFSDNEAPVFAQDAVAELSIECDDAIPYVEPSATDNCGDVSITYEDNVITESVCYSLIERVFTAIDECGNASEFVQTITIQDLTAPVFIDYVVEIEMPCDNYEGVFVSASDNCSEVEISYTDEHVSGGCQGRIIRTYYAMDACENTASVQQIITLTDETAPMAEVTPENITVECGNEIPMFIPSWYDNCDDELELFAASSVAYDNCQEIITRTWTATDNCGNSTTLTQVVTIVDTTAPEWEYVPASFTIECSEELPLPGAAFAYDICDQEVDVTMTETTEAGDCANNYTIVRTYTATDDCGNNITATQNIYVVDTTAPVFGEFQYQLTVECDAPIPYIAPEATDNCGDVVVTYSDNTIESSGCYSLVERTFTAIDDCGNEAYVSQWISIVDNTAPVFNDYVVEIEMPCDNYEGVFVSASDNCSEVEISYTDEHVSGGCQGRIIRTYYAMDACENTASVQQIITLTDETAPMAEVAPENITVECGNEIPMFIPSWYDNCDDELELYAASSVAYDNCQEIITRTWTATDNCGNSTTLTQVVTIVDTTAPEWEYVPASFTIECSEELPLPGAAFAYDICDQEVDVTMTETTEAGECANNYTIVRTYTATDDCGNSITATQNIYVVDTTAPVFGDFQYQLTVECDAPIPYIAPEATDNCGNVVVTYSDNTIESSGCYSLVERTFTAIDDCGNEAYVSQWISIVDNTAPVFNDYMVEIEMPCDNYEGVFVSASDNCSEVEISYTDEHVSGGCQGRIIRTYYAMDACENTASVQQIITLTDETAPMAEVAPENITVECGNEIPMFIPSWYDNCDDELELYAASSVAYDNCQEIITRTWTATDNCGNSTTLTQVVTIVDTTAPEWEYVPASFTIECSEELPLPGAAFAYDICDQEVDVTMTETTEAGECANNYTIVRTYTATDDCGNSITATQNIYVEDTTAPELGDIPAQVTYECDEDVALIEPSVFDACGDADLTYEDTVIESSQCYTLIQRVFTATDACGNSSSTVQMISIVDTTAPVFYDVLNGLEAPCDNYEGVFVSASDNCSEVEITYTDELIEGGCMGVIARTYTATDACGNSSTETQFIILTDQVAPIAEVQPENITVECGNEIPMFIPSWSDNCDNELELYAASSVAYDNCQEIITRTWTATDNCGNSTTLTQVVTIVDTTAPEWEYVPASFTIECSEELPLPGAAFAYDICDQEVDVTMTETTEAGDCANNYTIVRTYTATDDCGNSITATQNIYVADTTAPVFTYVPENNSVSCAEFNGIPMATALDACGEVEVTYTETSEVFSEEGTDGDCGQLTTFSAGGWGAPNGAAANYRDANFASAFPSGLTVGCEENTYTFTSADAIENFLPAGGTSNVISGATVNPTGVSNQLANQLVAASLSIGFDSYDPNFGASATFLGDLTYNNGTFDGMTVAQVVGYANNALGGCPQPYTLQQLASALEVINLNYDGNGVDLGNFSCGSESVCGIRYTRTYTATDACGNSSEASTEYIVFDNIAPEFDQTFENVTVECAGDIPSPEVATATDSCSNVEVATEVVVVESDDCGNQTLHVIYTAVDECGNTATTGYYIYVNDNTDPMFEACPENIVLPCDGEIPAAEILVATDNCDNEVEVIFDEFIIGDAPAEGSVADCNILTPALPEGNSCAYPTPWAMAMFGMPSQYRYYTVENGSFIEYPDGSIHVVAEMHSTNFEATGFDVDVWFNNPMDWSEWSTQGFPTSFKADCGGIAANHEDWMYYILQNGDGAELTGFGDFEGSALNLSHAPSNNYFGFQKGDGANNYNGADNGFGGWFTYNGFFQINEVPYGQNQGSVSGAGDFAFELDCCPDYQIVRQWTAMDCSGNTSSCVQTISFEASDATNNGGNIVQEYKPSKEDELAIGGVSMSPNPAKDNVNFKFKATLNTRVSIDVYDITGKLIGNVFASEVLRGNEYITSFDVSYLPNGVYFVKTNNGLKITTEKLVVSK